MPDHSQIKRTNRAYRLGLDIKMPSQPLLEVFSDDFQTPAQWLAYLRRHFGDDLTTQTIFDKPGARWTAEDFQALYVACWIYQPVEKGTYMIELDAAQRAAALAAYNRLPWRISSHLHGTGGSARNDWRFLAGYEELLVQMESAGKPNQQSDLFLKGEGHPVISKGHLKSWWNKWRTGAGNMASAELNAVASSARYEVTPRAAENYSKPYKALLGQLNLSGKLVTVQDVVTALRSRLPLPSGANRHVYPNARDRGSLAGELEQLADYAAIVIPQSTVTAAVIAARPDIDGVLASLRDRPASTDEQFFQEIHVNAAALDETLRYLARGLT